MCRSSIYSKCVVLYKSDEPKIGTIVNKYYFHGPFKGNEKNKSFPAFNSFSICVFLSKLLRREKKGKNNNNFVQKHQFSTLPMNPD